MVAVAFILALVAFALVIAAISFGGTKMHDYGRRIGALENKVDEMTPKPNSKARMEHRDVGEQFLFGLISLQDDMEILRAKLLYYQRCAKHVANGGSPDDPPTTWKSDEDDSDANKRQSARPAPQSKK